MKNAVALPGVQPMLLKWARETAHLTVEDVARSFKKQPEDIAAWEAGNAGPTYAQLEKLAYKLYKRPLASFFLPEPPPEKPPEADFRALPDADLRQLQCSTVLLIRKARAYQSSLEELFAGRSPVANTIWQKIALDPARPVGPQAQAVRAALAVPDVDSPEWRSSNNNDRDDAAMKTWRKAIEAAGVFVFKDTFKQKEISGFCLEHREFPVVMINNSTTKTRQIFSLLHELAHILLGRQAISTFSDEPLGRLPLGEQKIERFCNRVAAEVLVPRADFVAFTSGLGGAVEDWPIERFAMIAERYRVSREVILRMFRDADRVSQDFYEARKAEWDGQKASKSKGGGDHYNTKGVYISERLMSEVLVRYGRRQIDVAEAADFMGVKAKHIDEFENRYLAGLAA